MTPSTFAIIFSAVAVASSVATLVYAVRIRGFLTDIDLRLGRNFQAVHDRMLDEFRYAKQHVTAVLSDLGLEKKPEQQKK